MIASLLIALLVVIALYVGSQRLNGIESLVAIASFLLGAALIVFPWLASDLALRLNVGRGTDLVLYVAVLLNIFIVANFYFRFKRDEKVLIQLVRAMALQSPRIPTDSPIDAATERNTVHEFGRSPGE